MITAAAGDDGYLDWDAESSSERGYVDFPASSPHVVAVGGTRLSLGTGSAWAGETVWNGDGAGGGGCSVVFTAQPWQQNLANWSAVGCGTKRAVADVSADADPYTGVAVHDTSPECEYRYEEAKVKHVLYWCTIGGTSVASPLIASTFALAGGANGVEYPAKTLYENEVKSLRIAARRHHWVKRGMHETLLLKPVSRAARLPKRPKAAPPKAICLAGTGYDGPTGVGTPDGIAAFKPLPNPPTVVTGAASAISQTSATLGATVNPNGGEVSECKFQYGTTEAYGSSVSCSPPPGSEESPVAVSGSLAMLAANTTYHFRIMATNEGGSSYGSDETFKTLAAISGPTVSSVSPSSGSVNGGTPIKITGTGFVAGASVEIAQGSGAGPTAIPASNVVVVSPTEITATTGGLAQSRYLEPIRHRLRGNQPRQPPR